MSKLTNVYCTYTGGGVYVFHALYNNEVWILTDFDLCGYYDMDPAIIEDKYNCDYDSHLKDYHGPLPTWSDILSAIKEHYGQEGCTNIDLNEAEQILRYYNPDLTRRIDDND